ncbi:hypothetical protein D3C75_766740 [compost metagenome]
MPVARTRDRKIIDHAADGTDLPHAAQVEGSCGNIQRFAGRDSRSDCRVKRRKVILAIVRYRTMICNGNGISRADYGCRYGFDLKEVDTIFQTVPVILLDPDRVTRLKRSVQFPVHFVEPEQRASCTRSIAGLVS